MNTKKSFHDCYRFISDRKLHSYYGEDSSIYPFSDNSSDYIFEYFLNGGKKSLLLGTGLKKKIPNNRLQHVLSVFLLGIHIYSECVSIKEKIDENIEKQYNIENKCNSEPNDWLYTWFLTCLYHDIGYAKEKDNDIIKSLKNGKKIFLSSFAAKGIGISICKDLKNFDLSRNYFKYRKEKYNVLDHGIIGGIMLYTRLRKLYITDGLKEKHLTYSKCAYHLHRIAADAILRHNMWNVDKKTELIYDEYGLLPDLTEENKISLSEPFTFLLALCDTLEPIKRFDNVDVLKNINITVEKNIIVSFSENVSENSRYKNAIHDLSKWVDVNVVSNRAGDMEFKIELKF